MNCFQTTNSTEEKLLGIRFDSKLSFENHVSNLCKRASQKLHATTSLVNYINLSKRKALMKTFLISQFNYCLLVWMFYSRKLNNCINSLNEREHLEFNIRIMNPHFLNYYEKITL